MTKGRLANLGFTILDLAVVVIVLAILATVLVPQLADRQGDSVSATAEFNLGLLRSAIRSYQADHQGSSPALGDGTIVGLLPNTVANEPYLDEFPINPFTEQKGVRTTEKTGITTLDVMANNEGGWIYNPSTGQIWLDSIPGFDH